MRSSSEQKQIIDALVLNTSDAEIERDYVRRIYWKAFGILDLEEPMKRHGINWASDDDRIETVKQLIVPYESEMGNCTLVLTNFYQWPSPASGTVEEGIRLEVYRTDVSVTEHKDEKWFHGSGGEILIALDKDGNLDSPLSLVDPNTANSLINICEEEQKRQHRQKAEVYRAANTP